MLRRPSQLAPVPRLRSLDMVSKSCGIRIRSIMTADHGKGRSMQRIRRPSFLTPVSHGLCTSGVLDNTGSVARDLLAAERTFLAWARTGLGFLGAGTGLFSAYATGEQSSPASRRSQRIMPACGALWLNGAATLAFAIARYHSVAEHLKHNKFPTGKGGLVSILISTTVSSLFALAIVVHDETLAQAESTNAGVQIRGRAE